MTDHDAERTRIESDVRRMLADRARRVDPRLTGAAVRHAAQDRGTSPFASGSRLRVIGGPAVAAIVAAAAVITPFLLVDRGGSGPGPQPGAPRHGAPASSSRPVAPTTPPVSARPVPQTSSPVGVWSPTPTTAVPSSLLTPTSLPTPTTAATRPVLSAGPDPAVPSRTASSPGAATSPPVSATG